MTDVPSVRHARDALEDAISAYAMAVERRSMASQTLSAMKHEEIRALAHVRGAITTLHQAHEARRKEPPMPPDGTRDGGDWGVVTKPGTHPGATGFGTGDGRRETAMADTALGTPSVENLRFLAAHGRETVMVTKGDLVFWSETLTEATERAESLAAALRAYMAYERGDIERLTEGMPPGKRSMYLDTARRRDAMAALNAKGAPTRRCDRHGVPLVEEASVEGADEVYLTCPRCGRFVLKDRPDAPLNATPGYLKHKYPEDGD